MLAGPISIVAATGLSRQPMRCWILLCLALSVGPGCGDRGRESNGEVSVFTALDQEFSEELLERFEKEASVSLRATYDTESTKTVQLVARIMTERRPTCDVFWNNEILHTLRLQREGLLTQFTPAAAEQIPANYRSPDGYWYGLAARARVLVVNTELLPRDQWPDSIHDLTDPRWKGKIGIAKPLFGTTATHAAVLFSSWGEQQAQDYYRQVRENAQVLSGNKQVATDVGRGRLLFGITDTDDAIIERDNGRPVAIVFPDQGDDDLGTLFIPNTVCIIKGGPNPANAQQLADFILSPVVETTLARGRSAQFPVNRQVTERSRVLSDQELKWMEADFQAAAEHWDRAQEFLKNEFLR